MRFVKWAIPLLLAGITLHSALRLPSRVVQVSRLWRPQPSVPTLRVEPMPFVAGLGAEDQLRGRDDVVVTLPEGDQRKIAYLCEDGAQVKPGDLIAKVDTKDLLRSLEEARLAYSDAQARIAQQQRQSKSDIETAKDALEQAKRELEIMQKSQATELDTAEKELKHQQLLADSARLEAERQRRLASPEIGLVSRQQAEQAERSLRAADFSLTTAQKSQEFMKKQHASQVQQKQNEIANAEYRVSTAEAALKPAGQAARYSIESTKKRLERAQKDLEQAIVRASSAGTVVLGMYSDNTTRSQRPIKVGDSVWGGYRIALISNLSRMEVYLPIAETAISPVRVGQEALLTFEAIPGKSYSGRVESISPSARQIDTWENPNLKAGTEYFIVRVKVIHPDSKLRPALKCRALVVRKRLKSALAVPLSAVVRRQGKDFVFVREGDSFAPRPVTTADRNEEAVVIARGLRAGEVVALEDPTGAREE